MPDRPSVVAAIDFGTFGSGYCWAVTSTDGSYIPSHDINCNDYWTGADFRYPKNRSAVLLGENDETIAWGYDAQNKYTEDPAAWAKYAVEFKMHLGSGRLNADERIGRNETGKPTEFLIANYLRKLYGMAREHIAQAGYDDSLVNWYVTVPAIWSDFDKRVMHRAAVDAGFPAEKNRLTIVLEPEVAALYCMANEARAGSDAPAPIARHAAGSRVLIVDCGGGTTDIVPLTIRPDGTFDQVGEATGDTCGASRVTRNFTLNVLAERLGRDAFLNLVKEEPRAAAELIRAWEQARNVFDPAQRTPVRIELSMRAVKKLGSAATDRLAAAQGGEDDVVLISADDVRSLLDSSVDPICALVDQQLRRLERTGNGDSPARTAVYLVGGFANSQYLRRRLEGVVGNRAELYVPPRPENAVLFGAVQYGNNPARIRSRTARLTYGYGLLDTYEPHLDSVDRLYRNDEGTALCIGRFRTLVRRGDLVPSGTEITSRIYPRGADQSRVRLSFYASETTDPRYVDDGNATQIGVVTILLPDAGRRRFRAKERAIDVLTIFGETTIRVQAVDRVTGYRTDGQIEFTA